MIFLTNILADLLPETDNNCLIRGISAIKKVILSLVIKKKKRIKIFEKALQK